MLSRTLLCNCPHLNALPTLPPLPQQHSHPGLVSGTNNLERTHLLMLFNGSKTRRLHVVTPAAQPVIIPCRKQSGSQSHLIAQADSGTEQGLTTELRVTMELPYMRLQDQSQNNDLLPPNSEQLAQPRGLSELGGWKLQDRVPTYNRGSLRLSSCPKPIWQGTQFRGTHSY